MKTSFGIQLLCWILLGVGFCSLSFESWNLEVERMDRRLRYSFFGPRVSQKIEHEALREVGTPQEGSLWLSPTFKRFGLKTSIPDFQALDQWAIALAEIVIDRIHRTLCRLDVAIVMFPFNALVIFCFVGDGLMSRRVKQLRFDYPSPLVHRLTLHGFAGLFVISILLVLAPIPFAPLEIIAVSILSAWILETHLRHLPKRL
jgi:hypothetical protein